MRLGAVTFFRYLYPGCTHPILRKPASLFAKRLRQVRLHNTWGYQPHRC